MNHLHLIGLSRSVPGVVSLVFFKGILVEGRRACCSYGMDPYLPPENQNGDDSVDVVPLANRGAPCPDCKSTNTSSDDPVRSRPGILWVVLFGWIVILVRSAFSTKSEVCRDCGGVRRFRTGGNYVAMILLGVVILLFLLVWLGA